jgi:hypothetical protein
VTTYPLHDRELDAIYDLAIETYLADNSRRSLLLAGLAPKAAQHLARHDSPSEQLLSDLIELNKQGAHTPNGRQSPLCTWLENAARLTEHLEAPPARFREWCARLTRPPRFIALSFNADARESSKTLWENVIPEDRLWHFDLRDFATGLRAPPEAIRKAWQALAQQIDAERIPDNLGPIEFANRAVFSLVVWLGWSLHRLRAFTAFNFFKGQFIPFRGPLPVVRYQPTATPEHLHAELHPPAGPASTAPEAVLIVDLLGTATPQDFEKFPDDVRALAQRWLIKRKAPGDVRPEETTPLLRDLVQIFGELRHHRGIRTLHLGLLMPDVLGFFLGQQLHECGDFRLYEHYTAEHAYRFTLSLADAPKE